MSSLLFVAFLTIGTTPTDSTTPYGMRVVLYGDGLPLPELPEELKNPQPIFEQDGKQRQVGYAQLDGAFSIRSVPSPSQAQLQVVFSGTGTAHVTTYRGNLAIDTIFSSQVRAVTPLFIGNDRFLAGGTEAHVYACTDYLHVGVRQKKPFSSLVGGLAGRILERKRGELADKAAQKGAEKLGKQMAERVAAFLPKLNSKLSEGFDYMRRVRVRPRLTSFSTARFAEVQLRMIGLEKWTAAPEPQARRGFQVALHQNALSAFGDLLAGKKTQWAKVEEILESWLGHPSPERRPDQKIDSLHLVKKKPLTVQFANDRVQMTLRAQNVYRGKRKLDGIKLEAQYQPKLQDGNVHFVRVGKVEVDLLHPPPSGKLTLQQLTRLELMRRSFPQLLPTELVLDPDRFAEGTAITSVVCKRGWLALQVEASGQ